VGWSRVRRPAINQFSSRLATGGSVEGGADTPPRSLLSERNKMSKVIASVDRWGRKFYAEDLTGRVFGKLTVVGLSVEKTNLRGGSYRLKWDCLCECGKVSSVPRNSLINGFTKSCGCYRDTCRQLPGDEGSFRQRLVQYKTNARNRKLEFSLTKEEFRTITEKSCQYCGSTPKAHYVSNRKVIEVVPYLCNGIDRIDNTKGYVSENCVACCDLCNYMKRSMTVDDFLRHVRTIALNNEENSNRK
jgi:hypothetical protein